jgi:protocatechuate 3,4-dioxygenase beta subunit
MTTAHLVLLTVGLGVWLHAQEPIVGGPCEGCEAVFEGLPSSLSTTARLAPATEPGAPMTLTGRVLGADGRPRAGVIVYAYQTNTAGIYPPSSLRTGAAARHGALRGWTLSGPDGRYTFETIRPGTYPTRVNGRWMATRDIHLGRNIPGHAGC